MSAGVSDQRMKSQGNPGSNVCKEQIEGGGVGVSGVGGGEELVESWRHHQQHQQAPSYSAPISSPPDPYTAQGYYGTAGAAFQYQSFGVGDGTWSTNGTDPMTFLGGYAQHDSYAMDGVFGPSTTAFSTATFGQPTSAVTFNYFNSNGDYSTWGGQLGGRNKPYDEYYRQDGLYMPDGLKAVEAGVQGLSLVDSNKLDKELLKDAKDGGGGGGAPKKTWATIASQPAKPQPSTQSTGLKKKGPGMPPPPIIPGKHNMDIGTWDSGSSTSSSKPSSISNNNGPGPSIPPPPMAQPPSPMAQPPPPMAQPPPVQQKSPQQQQQQPQQQIPMQQQMHIQQQMVVPPQQGPMQGRPTWAPPQRAPMPRLPPPQPIIMQGPTQPPPQMPPPQLQQPPPQPALPHPVLDELKIKNNYNPPDFDLTAPNARFFVIKSYSEDDIHRSIKYEIWCSTDHGNKRLDTAFRECESEGGVIYLFFSVNSSGHFCGMAQMMSAVDYNSNSSVWSQDKWKGQFKVRWIYVKDVPNNQLRHIRLENNDNKPVTNSRDTQEVLHAKGLQMLRIMHGYKHSTSIFDDFIHYEKRQEEEDQRKVPEPVYKGNNHHQGNYEGKSHHHGGYEKHDSYGGGKGNYNRDNYNRDHGGYNKNHGYNKDHDGDYNKGHGGYNKDHDGGYNKGHDGGYNKGHDGGYNKGHGGYNKDHGGYNKDHGGYNKEHGNGGEGYGGGGGYKGHRGGDREQHGGYRDHREQQGGGYRPHHQMHKDRGDGSRGGGRGRHRPN